jgi:hypothetical protein
LSASAIYLRKNAKGLWKNPLCGLYFLSQHLTGPQADHHGRQLGNGGLPGHRSAQRPAADDLIATLADNDAKVRESAAHVLGRFPALEKTQAVCPRAEKGREQLEKWPNSWRTSKT